MRIPHYKSEEVSVLDSDRAFEVGRETPAYNLDRPLVRRDDGVRLRGREHGFDGDARPGFEDGILGALDDALAGHMSTEGFEEGGTVRAIAVEETALGLFSHYKRIVAMEYRPPDPAANPYLAFAALLLAGLDGIANKIEPGEPLDKNIYELPPEELKKVPNVAGSLSEALDFLEKDHKFLLQGEVFTEDFLEMWVANKRKEHDAIRLRPHPYEFFLYYDV